MLSGTPAGRDGTGGTGGPLKRLCLHMQVADSLTKQAAPAAAPVPDPCPCPCCHPHDRANTTQMIHIDGSRVTVCNGPTFGCVGMEDFLTALAAKVVANETGEQCPCVVV